MTKEFRSMRLAELCDIFSGFAFRSQDLVASGVPVLKIGNIQNKLVSEACADHFPEALFVKKLDRYTLARGDTLVAMTGAGSVGKFGRMPWAGKRFLVNQRVGIIRPYSPMCDPDFVYYSLSLEKYERTLYGYGMGAGQPNVSASQIGSLEISLPSIATQRRIASILSAYDDLIENNTRRIAILEEMASRIYEEWFVRFRFPGHEGVRMVESELGLVPEGWSVRALGDLVEDMRDTINPDAVAPNTPYVGLEHIPRRSIALADWGQATDVTSTKLRFREGDILFGKIRPYFHKVAVAPVAGVASSDAIVMRAKSSKDFGLALAVVSSDAFVAHATQTSNGTKMPRANWGVLRQYPVPTPPDELQARFNDFMEKVVATVSNYVLRNRKLRATRDLLLPKLISGELDVSTLPESQAETA